MDNGVEEDNVIETTGIEAQQDENQHAFLRYLPKRIAAFEKRILRYRFEGWDPRGMAVLSGDVRRVADASAHFDLIEIHQHLLTLAQMVDAHFASMRAPDPRQVERMFALLSAVIRSLASHPDAALHAAPTESTHEAPRQQAASGVPTADAMPLSIVEGNVPTEGTSVDRTEPPAPEEVAEPSAPIEAAEPEEQVAPLALVEPAEPVEPEVVVASAELVEPGLAIDPADLVVPVVTIEPTELFEMVELDEPVETREPYAHAGIVEPARSLEDRELGEPVTSAEPDESAEPEEPDEQDEPEAPGEIGMRRVYHLSDGNAFALELGQRLESEGYAVEPVESVDELSELLLCLMPQLLLVDASLLAGLAAIGILRRDAQQRAQPRRRIQMVVMAQDNLDTRRAAHRAGADLLLFAPFDIADIAARLQALHATIAVEKVRVLIVEDNRTDALFAQAVLTRAGMQADVEHDPMQVLETLKSQRPDLILMDLHMPFANGVEVTMLIRENPLFARLPIVFLSGESDPDSRLEAINAGGDDFLFKPIRPKHLIAAVQDRVRRMHPVNKQGTAAGSSDD